MPPNWPQVSLKGPLQPVRVQYLLDGAGWARLNVTVQGLEQVVITASYLTDSLLSLLRATRAVISGTRKESWAWFAEEPGQYTIHLQVLPQSNSSSSSDQPMRLILSFNREEDMWAEHEVDGPTLVLDAIVGLRGWGRAVSVTAHAVLQQHGLQGYREDWMVDFPLAELQALDVALTQQAAADADAAEAAAAAAAGADGAPAEATATAEAAGAAEATVAAAAAGAAADTAAAADEAPAAAS